MNGFWTFCPLTSSLEKWSDSNKCLQTLEICKFICLTCLKHAKYWTFNWQCFQVEPGRIAQSLRHLTRKSGVPGSIPGLATYFRFSFRFFKKGSCLL